MSSLLSDVLRAISDWPLLFVPPFFRYPKHLKDACDNDRRSRTKKGKKDVESAEKLLLAGGYQLAVESVAFGLNTAFGKSRLHRAAGLGRVQL